ncbi:MULTISPECIES: hypothetical protein [Vibrio]|uniref:hypothetical protein n=1 Tax=Vibrio TaxID=662 RepID=UPI000841D0CA|nr:MULTISPECIES: hypothetical protein [Vibrio]ODM56884.1 hypothetical protein BC455_18665 [Vibrio harveyi]USD58474.1 hypothetical protein J4N44_27665 [Vibrio sp. SCSIO 43155]
MTIIKVTLGIINELLGLIGTEMSDAAKLRSYWFSLVYSVMTMLAFPSALGWMKPTTNSENLCSFLALAFLSATTANRGKSKLFNGVVTAIFMLVVLIKMI